MRSRVVAMALFVVALAAFADAQDSAPVPAAPADARPVAELLKELRDGDVAARRRAVFALWNRGPSMHDGVDVLGAALVDRDDYVADVAARALDRLGPASAPAFDGVEAALGDGRAKVRAAAAHILWKMGPPSKDAVPSLLPLLKDADADVRLAVVETLSPMGQYGVENPEDIVRALAAAMNDADPRVRRKAAFALAGFGEAGEIARDDLIRRLDDPDAEVRAYAANALWVMGRSARKGLGRLYALLDDPSQMVRGRALGAVASIDPKDARLAPSIIAAAKDADGGVRLAATGMLYLAGPSAVPALIAALRDGDPMVRFEATKGCRELGPAAARAAPFLADALHGNADAMYASVVAQALGRVGGPDAADAVPELRRIMARPGNASLRSECALAVWRLDPARVDEVLRVMTSLLGEPLTAYYAANTLGEMGAAAAPAVPHVILVLDAELDDVRMGAAVALGRIGAAAAPAVSRLETIARDDPSERVRPKATEALAKIRAASPKEQP